MTLRARLTLGLGIVAVAFALIGWVVVGNQQKYLAEQLDRRLENSMPLAMNLLDDRPAPLPLSPDGEQDLGELYIGLLGQDGVLVDVVRTATGERPAISVDVALAHDRNGGGPQPFSATAESGGTEFRVMVMRRPGPQTWAVVALSTTERDDASDRLFWTAGLGALGVLAVIALTWLWVLRLGVRPITEMTKAADAIAGGDRSAALPSYPELTEAAHLSRAFGEMLAARDAADGRLRQFVADASHELRTPLTSIRGYTELYQQGAFREPARLDDAMRRVGSEAERMGRIVNDMLLLSKLDQGVALAVSGVDLSALVHDVAADARAIQPERAVIVDVPATLPSAADGERLHQALLALVHNALTHTPVDTPLELSAAAGADGSATIDVVDHGPGMPAEMATHAFERFYRGDPSRSRHSGGSGLGLSIVQSIVEAHGGRISLATAPGQGCRFRIALPPAPAAPPRPPE